MFLNSKNKSCHFQNHTPILGRKVARTTSGKAGYAPSYKDTAVWGILSRTMKYKENLKHNPFQSQTT